MTTGEVFVHCTLAALLFSGCRKEDPAFRTSIDHFKVLDVNTVNIKQLPNGGYMLQCTEDETLRRLDFAQFLTSEGDLAGRIDYRTLPDSIEGLRFTSGVKITDIIPWENGEYILLGLGNVITSGMPLESHLIVYQVDANGDPTAPPFRRLIEYNCSDQAANPYLEPMSLAKALGARLSSGDLIVAVHYTVIFSAYLKFYRFPLSGLPNMESTETIPVDFGSPLWAVQSITSDEDRAIIVADLDQENLLVRVLGFDPENIIDLDAGLLWHGSLRPYAIERGENGAFILAGSSWHTFPDLPAPFIAQFDPLNLATLTNSYRRIESDAPAGEVSQSYGAVLWRDRVAMLINTYPYSCRGALFPERYGKRPGHRADRSWNGEHPAIRKARG